MKETTLEEAAERYAEDDPYNRYEKCFINGAKWQAERMYSEEDMIEFGFNTYHYISELMGWPFRQVSENKLHVMYNLEQYKKK